MKLGSNVYPSLRSGVKDQLQTCVRHESVSLALSSWWQAWLFGAGMEKQL